VLPSRSRVRPLPMPWPKHVAVADVAKPAQRRPGKPPRLFALWGILGGRIGSIPQRLGFDRLLAVEAFYRADQDPRARPRQPLRALAMTSAAISSLRGKRLGTQTRAKLRLQTLCASMRFND
jgi:hypothetical protein